MLLHLLREQNTLMLVGEACVIELVDVFELGQPTQQRFLTHLPQQIEIDMPGTSMPTQI